METTLTQTENQMWRIEGELTFGTVKELFTKSEKLWENHKALTVDLSSVKQVDSAALALLIEWQNRALKEDKKIVFKHAPNQLLNLAKASHLNKLLNIKS